MIGMSLLAILDEGPSYGLRLKNEFELRTAGVWQLNVGQVYTTLGRLQRDGLVDVSGEDGPEPQKFYEITDAGRTALKQWFEQADGEGDPSRDALVLKLVMASGRSRDTASGVIQNQRRRLIEVLQDYTKLKRDAPADADLGWSFVLDSLIFQTEARVRWLDACEARLSQRVETQSPSERNASPARSSSPKKVRA
jgi:DNA-binding PadR family transcriptional regulator